MRKQVTSPCSLWSTCSWILSLLKTSQSRRGIELDEHRNFMFSRCSDLLSSPLVSISHSRDLHRKSSCPVTAVSVGWDAAQAVTAGTGLLSTCFTLWQGQFKVLHLLGLLKLSRTIIHLQLSVCPGKFTKSGRKGKGPNSRCASINLQNALKEGQREELHG